MRMMRTACGILMPDVDGYDVVMNAYKMGGFN